METEGGGWTAIQKRGSGSESFNRSWVDYQNGFGEANDSYWIGNDLIHELTKGNDSSLYISISLQNGNTFYERYQLFSIADETDDYRLLLGGPANGTLGDSMLNPNFQGKDLSGMPFSAPDRDNDKWGGGSCAAYREGGWWFNNCHWAFLNGPWAPAYWHNLWYPTVRNGDSVTEIKMLIKRH
ncbi:fibroleukin-like [Saccostrea cucullata]